MSGKSKTPIIVISVITAVVVVILIISIIAIIVYHENETSGSSTTDAGSPTADAGSGGGSGGSGGGSGGSGGGSGGSGGGSGGGSTTITPIVKKAVNTTSIIKVGTTIYYLLCLTDVGLVTLGNNTLLTEIQANNNTIGGNYVGNTNFWDNLVKGMITELGSNVAVGSSSDFKANFTDPGSLCTQANIGSLNNNTKVLLLNSSSSGGFIADAAPLLDYTCAIYLSDGILIPPKPKFSYSNAIYPGYQTKASTSTSWTLIPTQKVGVLNNAYDPTAKNMYSTQFILLKTNGSTALDTSLKNQGYYLNTTVWDPASTSSGIFDNLAANTLILSPSFFPPFTKMYVMLNSISK